MYFANPWGLLGLLTLPAIAFIHLYQRRYPPHYVGGLFLWATDQQVRMPGRRRDRLPVTTTLILELIAAFVLSLVLADPRFGEWDRATHLVAVLDHSASMQGKPAGEPSFRESAIRELERRMNELPRDSAVTLIRTGVTPVTLIRRGSIDAAKEALKNWQPMAPQHRFAPAWEELGQQLVEESGTILFLTDQMPDPREIPKTLEVVAVGRKLDNVAFDAARWTFNSEKFSGQVFVRVRNYGRDTAQCTLTAVAGGKEVLNRPLSIPADQVTALDLPVPGGLGELTLNIQKSDDGSQFDNRVQLIEPKVRSVKVALALPKGNDLQEVQRVLKITPEITMAPLDQASLIIGPAGSLPPSKAGLWWFGIGPIDPSESARKAAKDLLGPYLIDKRHPLADGLSLGGVVWGGAQVATAETITQLRQLALSGVTEGARAARKDLVPIISAGQSPLLVQLRGSSTTAFLLNIDLAKSNLTESPDWPVLIDNLIEQRRDALPGLRRWNYRVGEVVRFRLFDGQDAPTSLLTLFSPSGSSRKLVVEDLIEIGDLQEPGVYTINLGDQPWGKFAVNFFDPAESDMRTLHPGQHAAIADASDPGITVDNPYTWAIWLGTICILGLLFADWLVLRPKPVK